MFNGRDFLLITIYLFNTFSVLMLFIFLIYGRDARSSNSIYSSKLAVKCDVHFNVFIPRKAYPEIFSSIMQSVVILTSLSSYTEDDLPSHECLHLDHNCEQVLTMKISRRLITMTKTCEMVGTGVRK